MSTLELAERNEIHKSCKSLEILLNVFNDYCEAAGAIATIEKKLVKALKDVASLKITGQNAASAFSASASIFEASTDVDSKYAKIVDKEYDTISNEVKKWFKKLAKEEKLHDERLVNANARIKQASQSLEKKTKRNARDSGDEHTRYMNLISSIGPEISQERYSHSLMITQKQSATTHSVAACISRVADAEWHRVCESVKNCAPNIGFVGQYRALCEGGWTAAYPSALPNNESSTDRLQVAFDPQPIDGRTTPTTPTTRSPAMYSKELPLPSPTTENQPRKSFDNQPRKSFDSQPRKSFENQSRKSFGEQRPPPSAFEPPRALVDPNTGSVRSLSAFPAPPTHFPVPAPITTQNRPGSRGPLPNPTSPPMSPAMRNSMLILQDPVARPALAARQSSQDIHAELMIRTDTGEAYGGLASGSSPEQSHPHKDMTPEAPRRDSPTSTSNSDSISSATKTLGRGDYKGDEQGNKRRSIEQRPQGLVRSDTTDSAGSIVAAIRNKYVQNSETASLPPKDIPRLPLSVSDLATRYQVNDETPISPRSRPASPFMPRPLPNIDTRRQADANGGVFKEPSSPKKTHRHHVSLPANNLHSELPYLSETEARVKDKERELRVREKEIEQRTQELDMQLNKMNARGGYVTGPTQSGPAPRPPFPKRASSQMDLAMQINSSRTINHSSSTTSLVPPPSPVRQRRMSQETSPRSSTDHSPSCGCETCSVSKYRSASPNAPVMYIRPNPNEKKSWMRRLSMPSVNPKKNSSHKNGLMSLDGRMNFSTTMLHGGIPEDDAKVSYEANRSVTSLGGFRQ